jgi:hypothetical protein
MAKDLGARRNAAPLLPNAGAVSLVRQRHFVILPRVGPEWSAATA